MIAEGVPGLSVATVRFFEEGWDYELWEVNGELLFRFPKRAECAMPLMREARLLSELADALTTPVPRPEHIYEGDAESGMPFFAYRKLAGVPLSIIDEAHRAGFAQQIGHFLSELHRFPVKRAIAAGIPALTAESWREKYRAFRDEVRDALLPLLTPGEQATVETFWRSFLDDDRHFQFRPALVHGDLGLEHILVDPDTATLTGVIDFADAMIGDPAIDFVVVHAAFGEAPLAGYDLPADETLLTRARAYLQIGPFHEVLYGQQTRQPRFVESGLEGIRRRIITDVQKA